MPSREEAMLGRLAELDLAAAEKVHARLMAAEDADEIDRFGRTYHRLTRSLRQTLALKARLAREREIHRIRTTPLAMTPREASRRHLTPAVRAHIDKAAAAALRFVERERETPDYDGEYDFLGRTEIYEILEDLAQEPAFLEIPVDDLIAAVIDCLEEPAEGDADDPSPPSAPPPDPAVPSSA